MEPTKNIGGKKNKTKNIGEKDGEEAHVLYLVVFFVALYQLHSYHIGTSSSQKKKK